MELITENGIETSDWTFHDHVWTEWVLIKLFAVNILKKAPLKALKCIYKWKHVHDKAGSKILAWKTFVLKIKTDQQHTVQSVLKFLVRVKKVSNKV